MFLYTCLNKYIKRVDIWTDLTLSCQLKYGWITFSAILVRVKLTKMNKYDRTKYIFEILNKNVVFQKV